MSKIPPNRKFTDEQFLELYNKKFNDNQIAKILNVSSVAVWQRRRKFDLMKCSPFGRKPLWKSWRRRRF